MREQKFNAKEKKVSRMSRDGLVEENLATKESRKLTDRESEVSFKKSDAEQSFVSGNDASGKKQKKQENRSPPKEEEGKSQEDGDTEHSNYHQGGRSSGYSHESAMAVRERKAKHRSRYHNQRQVKPGKLQFDKMETDGSLNKKNGNQQVNADAEPGTGSPRLQQAEEKAKKSAEKLQHAKKHQTRKKSIQMQRVKDEETQTVKHKLYFDESPKSGKNHAAVKKTGVRLSVLIQGADEGSGVAAIYVNGNEFTELTNGALQVRLQKADTTYQYFTLQVRDNAGNISENYKVANPYYEDPEAVKETPSGTGEEQKNNSLPADANATPPTSAKADVTEHQTTGNTSAEPTEPENVDTDTGRVQEVPSGTEKSGKEFYTIQTKSDKVFYLIIDNEKTDENVYLLTEVSENDLLNFTDSNMVTLPQNNAIQETALPLEKEENTEETEPEPTEKPEPEKEPEKKSENNSGTMLIMLLVLGAVGGGYYYLKFVKGKNGSFDADYDDEDEDDMEDEETFEEESDEEPENEEPEEDEGEYPEDEEYM